MEVEEEKADKYRSSEDLFTRFSDAEGFQEILHSFKALCRAVNITSLEGIASYYQLKSHLRSWKCQALWDLIDARASLSVYGQGKFCENVRVFIVGSGPIGLRTAIECALLGCKVVIVEKRTSFTRNNVLHLWTFLLHDFRALGAKKFYGKFGSGSIDHVSIQVLQGFLLKTALLLGVQVFSGITFQELVEPSTDEDGWRAKCTPENHPVNKWRFNVVIGADGKKNVLPGFQQIEMRGKVAIGITCNFVNYNTIEEAAVQEISGIAYQFRPEFFDKLNAQQGIRLENIVYYKDATHYFVMTAIKSSLVERGVLKQDFGDPAKLLMRSNVNLDELMSYTCDVVNYATDFKLPKLDFEELPNGEPDIALFDFTSIKKASNACRVLERKGQRLLMALVGDSLLEPFWPTGSGCARGVLSALDTAWMIRQYGKGYPPLYVIRDRENIFKLLSGTSNENLQKNISGYTIDPKTRYAHISSKKLMTTQQLKAFYDTDDPEHADYSIAVADERGAFEIGVRYPINKVKAGKRISGGRRRTSSKGKSRRKSSHSDSKASSRAVSGDGEGRKLSKRSKRTGSPSGSVSSAAHSVSESDHDMHSGSGSSMVYSRQNSHASHSVYDSSTESAIDSRLGTHASQSELDDVFLSSSPPKGDTKSHSKKHRQAATEEVTKHSKSWFRRKVSHQKSGNSESEHNRLAVRKSIGQGKKHKVRRLSKEHGPVHHKERENHERIRDVKRLESGKVRELKQVLSSELNAEQAGDVFKEPLQAKTSSGSLKNGRILVKNGDRVAVSKSCKELIAEAEAREKARETSVRGNLSSVSRDVPRSLKRKVDEQPAANKRKSLNRKVYELLADLMASGAAEQHNESATPEHTVEAAIPKVAGLLLAVPLLLKCSSDFGTTSAKPTDTSSAPRSSLTPSDSLGKTEGQQFQRAGSVQKRREEYLAMIARRESEKKSFHDFKRTKAGAGQGGNEAAETASIRSCSSQASNDQTDFVPKDVIDAETCLLPENEEARPINANSGDSQQPKMKKAKDPLKCRDSLEVVLERLMKELKHSFQEMTITILISLHRKIQRNPNVDMFYRVHLMGEMFQKYIWNVHAARDFLEVIGWTRCGSFIVLSKSVVVTQAVAALSKVLRDIKGRVSMRRQGTVNQRSPRIEASASRNVRKFDSVPPTALVDVKALSTDEGLENSMDDMTEGSGDHREKLAPEAAKDEVPDHLFANSSHLGDDEYLILSYNEKDRRTSTPMRPEGAPFTYTKNISNLQVKDTDKLTKERPLVLKGSLEDMKDLLTNGAQDKVTDKEIEPSLSTPVVDASSVPKANGSDVLINDSDRPNTGIDLPTNRGGQATQNSFEPSSNQADYDVIEYLDTDVNISKIRKPSVEMEANRGAVPQPVQEPLSHVDPVKAKSHSKKLSLNLGFKRHKERTKSLASPTSDSSDAVIPALSDGEKGKKGTGDERKKRSRSKLALGLGTWKSKKEQKEVAKSPTSESEDPLSPDEGDQTKKKKKKKKKPLMRIVRKFKRHGSRSEWEGHPDTLVVPDDNALALTSSWANINNDDVMTSEEEKQKSSVKDTNKEVALIAMGPNAEISGNRGSSPNVERLGAGMPKQDIPSMSSHDMGLNRDEDQDHAVQVNGDAHLKNDAEREPPKSKKKSKLRVLKVKKKKDQPNDAELSKDRKKGSGNAKEAEVIQRVSYIDSTTFEIFGPKGTAAAKENSTPPRRTPEKLKSISTEPVEI